MTPWHYNDIFSLYIWLVYLYVLMTSFSVLRANIANRKRYRFGKPRNHNGFWVFSCHILRCNSKDIISPKRPLGRTWTKYMGFLGQILRFISQGMPLFSFFKLLNVYVLGGCAWSSSFNCCDSPSITVSSTRQENNLIRSRENHSAAFFNCNFFRNNSYNYQKPIAIL